MNNAKTAIALIITAAFISEREDEWYITVDFDGSVRLTRHFYDAGNSSAVDRMAEVRRGLGGKWDKRTTEYEFTLSKSIGENVTVELQTSRSAACTPRVVGKETVEVKDYSDVPTKTVERDVVEWDCNPILDS